MPPAKRREEALGRTASCIFLFFRRRPPEHRAPAVARSFAALHKRLVKNNENTSKNTSAGTARTGRSLAGTHWIFAPKWRGGAPPDGKKQGREGKTGHKTNTNPHQ